MPGKTTPELVKELKGGRDREANFQQLFDRYYALLHRYFQRKGIAPEDCDALTQEAFISVYKGLRALRQEAQFENWLYTIALNAYRSEIERRGAKKRASSEISLEGQPRRFEEFGSASVVPKANPMEAVLEKEKSEKLREALHELPAQMRRCVQLRMANGLSNQEVASVMGVSVNTVKAHLFQARRILRERLSAYFFNEIEV